MYYSVGHTFINFNNYVKEKGVSNVSVESTGIIGKKLPGEIPDEKMGSLTDFQKHLVRKAVRKP